MSEFSYDMGYETEYDGVVTASAARQSRLLPTSQVRGRNDSHREQSEARRGDPEQSMTLGDPREKQVTYQMMPAATRPVGDPVRPGGGGEETVPEDLKQARVKERAAKKKLDDLTVKYQDEKLSAGQKPTENQMQKAYADWDTAKQELDTVAAKYKQPAKAGPGKTKGKVGAGGAKKKAEPEAPEAPKDERVGYTSHDALKRLGASKTAGEPLKVDDPKAPAPESANVLAASEKLEKELTAAKDADTAKAMVDTLKRKFREEGSGPEHNLSGEKLDAYVAKKLDETRQGKGKDALFGKDGALDQKGRGKIAETKKVDAKIAELVSGDKGDMGNLSEKLRGLGYSPEEIKTMFPDDMPADKKLVKMNGLMKSVDGLAPTKQAWEEKHKDEIDALGKEMLTHIAEDKDAAMPMKAEDFTLLSPAEKSAYLQKWANDPQYEFDADTKAKAKSLSFTDYVKSQGLTDKDGVLKAGLTPAGVKSERSRGQIVADMRVELGKLGLEEKDQDNYLRALRFAPGVGIDEADPKDLSTHLKAIKDHNEGVKAELEKSGLKEGTEEYDAALKAHQKTAQDALILGMDGKPGAKDDAVNKLVASVQNKKGLTRSEALRYIADKGWLADKKSNGDSIPATERLDTLMKALDDTEKSDKIEAEKSDELRTDLEKRSDEIEKKVPDSEKEKFHRANFGAYDTELKSVNKEIEDAEKELKGLSAKDQKGVKGTQLVKKLEALDSRKSSLLSQKLDAQVKAEEAAKERDFRAKESELQHKRTLEQGEQQHKFRLEEQAQQAMFGMIQSMMQQLMQGMQAREQAMYGQLWPQQQAQPAMSIYQMVAGAGGGRPV